jgi:hypothetical protein
LSAGIIGRYHHIQLDGMFLNYQNLDLPVFSMDQQENTLVFKLLEKSFGKTSE